MADAVWPAGLPQAPKLADLDETPPDLTVRTQMDAGPAKVRRRLSAHVRIFSIGLDLTRNQVATFDAFFLTTLQGGALAFTWKNPDTGNQADFRIVGLPRYTPRSPRLSAGTEPWRVVFTVELLPGTEVASPPTPPPAPDPVQAISFPHAGSSGAEIPDPDPDPWDQDNAPFAQSVIFEPDTPPPEYLLEVLFGRQGTLPLDGGEELLEAIGYEPVSIWWHEIFATAGGSSDQVNIGGSGDYGGGGSGGGGITSRRLVSSGSGDAGLLVAQIQLTGSVSEFAEFP